ncbi:hypothetical protein MJO28_011847 [Puccinia striiformis f. sp. tritici]|uniref:Uncharacterized protein n=1 Tax=Puccinia striiformis f. sp. tritici TaxID=168172 RepID=A0ACC0E4W1_9BASI|nr:hypothetical protein MJO28_011847 [Puccinia striiformis f. sp. tritici]
MLGKDYEQLRGMRTTEVGMLTLLWKAKSDLFATAVDVRAERQPLISTDSGNILGTRLKEKIMAAIQRRSKPVDRAIKLFNQRRREYLQKYDPSRLRLPENKDMTLSEFQSMDLDDPLWNDGHFYHTRAPWATDPLYTKSEHPWFNVIETVKKHLNGADMAFIDDALENLTFAENGTNVEEQEQAENNAQDFEIPANEQPSDEGVDGEGRDGNEDGNSVMNTNAGAA